jgi:hypothetical protein
VDWKQEMLWLTVLYRMLECGDSIPLDVGGTAYAFIEDELRQMHARDLIEVGKANEYWVPTDKAQALRRTMLAMYDQALKFEIFAGVNLSVELDGDCSDDGAAVFDDVFDPRFAEPDNPEQADELGSEDMRLAVMTWLAKTLIDSDPGRAQKLEPIDPHRVVFFQFLADGRFKDENVWFDLKLGQPFAEIDEIVESAYRYTDVSDDPSEVDRVMRDIYAAGMLEQRKREGRQCPGCNIPLGAFELHAKEDGQSLEVCPNPECQHELLPVGADDDGWVCPTCNTACERSQQFCMDCGARLDWSLPAEALERTDARWEDDSGEYVWGGYYGYTPYGWYHPYDPLYDAVAFGVLCAVIF